MFGPLKPGWPWSVRPRMIWEKGTSSYNCWHTALRRSSGSFATLPTRGRLLGGKWRRLEISGSFVSEFGFGMPDCSAGFKGSDPRSKGGEAGAESETVRLGDSE